MTKSVASTFIAINDQTWDYKLLDGQSELDQAMDADFIIAQIDHKTVGTVVELYDSMDTDTTLKLVIDGASVEICVKMFIAAYKACIEAEMVSEADKMPSGNDCNP